MTALPVGHPMRSQTRSEHSPKAQPASQPSGLSGVLRPERAGLVEAAQYECLPLAHGAGDRAYHGFGGIAAAHLVGGASSSQIPLPTRAPATVMTFQGRRGVSH